MNPPQGVTKTILRPGNGRDSPHTGDTVIIDYTGYLYDDTRGENEYFMGTQFDTSQGRGPLKTEIGVGKVILGWDKGVQQMTLGEKAILTISSDNGYGKRGFPGLIPPDSGLVLYVCSPAG
uniref:FK506-binding protein 1B n=1 Tax=Emericella nidulans (strain FGSC A4 / ATCC 38163 / CBS 112.46 / NRRL 194 / M139) TaxID=227321 RepID=FKB1B_EMENI|nr:RecName: Full=FK506-binding protein 1B; Short=FKBP; AltName: Full=Peptidyl-prolyl cis-trans isomerase; Short=PPIase; AltName: Full=Rapamycin-binding protein [Aspergillus nidulans FGSC A4]